jgi:hypothetical protein
LIGSSGDPNPSLAGNRGYPPSMDWRIWSGQRYHRRWRRQPARVAPLITRIPADVAVPSSGGAVVGSQGMRTHPAGFKT